MLLATPDVRVQFVPDDGFYYLTLARNFARGGEWTFDSGVSVTTGFHLLHGYALAALFRLANPGPDRFVQAAVLVTWAAALPAGIAAAVFAVRSRRVVPPLVLLLFVLSRNTAGNAVSAMEWGWTVWLSAGYFLLFAEPFAWSLPAARAALAICGFLGSLARSDFGLMPLALALASLVCARTVDDRRRSVTALAGLIGALAGVIAVTGHNFLVSGQALQSSARMKSLWSAAEGRSPRPFILTFLSLFGRPTPLTFRICAAIALLALIAGISAIVRGGTDRQRRTDWIGAALTLFGYVAFNAFNPTSAQPWYTANAIVPAFLFIAVPAIEHRVLRAVPWLMTVLLLALIARETPRALTFTSDSPYPDQISMYRAGRYLEGAALPGRVGSWNAGIIGFYEGGRVVNLDGLVNNDVYRFSASNRLLQYMDSVSVQYVVDFEQMVTSDYFRQRGGYDGPSAVERFVPLRRFDDRTEGWSRMTLYRVKPAAGE